MFFQVDGDNKHSLRQNPATYTQILNSAARGLYRYCYQCYWIGYLLVETCSSLPVWASFAGEARIMNAISANLSLVRII